MELRVQLEKWAAQAESADMDAVADMGVAVRLINHGIEALEQLEAAKQRELELLAVIERMKAALVELSMNISEHRTTAFYDLVNIEPSQALREHEANVFEEAASHVELNGYYAVADELRRMAEERRKK